MKTTKRFGLILSTALALIIALDVGVVAQQTQSQENSSYVCGTRSSSNRLRCINLEGVRQASDDNANAITITYRDGTQTSASFTEVGALRYGLNNSRFMARSQRTGSNTVRFFNLDAVRETIDLAGGGIQIVFLDGAFENLTTEQEGDQLRAAITRNLVAPPAQ